MDHDPGVRSARFDPGNFAVGALVTAGLVILLGAGPMALILATPREEGANIGGGLLGILSALLAAAFGSAFTARRAVRRNGDPMAEGIAASMTGLVVVILAVGLLFAILTPLPLEAVPGMLQLAVPSLAAAFVGAAVGGGGRTHPQR